MHAAKAQWGAVEMQLGPMTRSGLGITLNFQVHQNLSCCATLYLARFAFYHNPEKENP